MVRFNDRYCPPRPPEDDDCECGPDGRYQRVTENLELPLYDRRDDADLRRQYNTAMRILDEAVVQRNNCTFGHGTPDRGIDLEDSNVGDFYVDVDTGQIYELDYAGR